MSSPPEAMYSSTSRMRFDGVPPIRECSIVIWFAFSMTADSKRARIVIRDAPCRRSSPIDPAASVPTYRVWPLCRSPRLTSPTAALTHTFWPALTAERTCPASVAVTAPATHDGRPSGGSGKTGGGPTPGAGKAPPGARPEVGDPARRTRIFFVRR